MNEETIKQFLKPDWGKIIVFVVLACFSWYMYAMSTAFEYEPRGYTIAEMFWIIINIVPFILAQLITVMVHTFHLPLLSFVVFSFAEIGIPFLWYYLLSCLIVFAWNKI